MADDEEKSINEPIPSVDQHHGVVVPVSEEEHTPSMSPAATPAERGTLGMDCQLPYKAQTSIGFPELEEMLTKTATTPRKTRRVCNMLVYFRPMIIRVAAKRAPP